MIENAAQFKALLEGGGGDDSYLGVEAVDSVWIEILESYPQFERQVLENHTISPVVLERLAHSAEWRTRHSVASKRRLNRNTFEILARDIDSSVRHRIARNPKAPKDLLEILCKDEDELVSVAAKGRF